MGVCELFVCRLSVRLDGQQGVLYMPTRVGGPSVEAERLRHRSMSFVVTSHYFNRLTNLGTTIKSSADEHIP